MALTILRFQKQACMQQWNEAPRRNELRRLTQIEALAEQHFCASLPQRHWLTCMVRAAHAQHIRALHS